MEYEEVLAYWFASPLSDEASVLPAVRRWFHGGAEVDEDVRSRFGDTVAAALTGQLDRWAATPRGRLALVIVLDQLARNALRGKREAHAGDLRAQQLATEAFDLGMNRELSWIEQVFLSMPLLHAEDPAAHARLEPIVGELAETAPRHLRRMADMHAEQAAKYSSVIRRFGRFPHRNAILGRASTAEERDFLADWAERGPPRGAGMSADAAEEDPARRSS